MSGHKSKPKIVELMTNVPIEKLSKEKQKMHLLLFMNASTKRLKFKIGSISKILKIMIKI